MSKGILLATSAALALVGTGSVSADGVRPAASVEHQSKHAILFPQRGANLLYDQDDGDNPQAIVAQNFETVYDVYDSEAADDFMVPAGKTWEITKVHAAGTSFDGAGPADSFNVTFYSSKKGKVGKVVKTCANASYSYSDLSMGPVDIKCKARLERGSYFVGVQANMNFSQGGEWGWLTNNTIRRSPSMWRNPGDGFSTGCTTFTTTTTCIPVDEGGDFAFALYGKQQ